MCPVLCYFLWICVKEVTLENPDISMVKLAEVPEQKEKETKGTGHSDDALKQSDKDPGSSDNVVSEKTVVASIGGEVRIWTKVLMNERWIELLFGAFARSRTGWRAPEPGYARDIGA